jgi:hypothetical protein
MDWGVYVCTACGLMIETGWLRYVYTRTKDPLKRYSASMCLICKECGAQYMIELAGKWRRSAYLHPLKDYGLPLPDRLWGRNRRIFLKGLPKKSPENYDRSDRAVAFETARDQHRGYYRDEWHEINPIETKFNQIVLSKEPCHICLTVGKIGVDIRSEDACPHCKETTLLGLYGMLE